MADSRVVNVAALRAAAAALTEEGGPLTYLENAKAALTDAVLGDYDLTIVGMSAVTAHNTAASAHLDNVAGGIKHLAAAAGKLKQTADNWAESDLPWVVK